MRRLTFRLAAAVITFVAGVAAAAVWLTRPAPEPAQTSRPPDRAAHSDEARIYSVVVDEILRRRGGPFDLVVIKDHTSTDERDGLDLGRTLEYVKERMPSLSPETVEDFRARNGRPHQLGGSLDPAAGYALVTAEEIKEIFAAGGGWWPAFYRKYPKSQGILTVSAVGYNAAKDQALVYRGNQYAAFGGDGGYLLLGRQGGVWVIRQLVGTWVS